MRFNNINHSVFFRFCIVGTVCTGLDVCIFYIVRMFTSYPIALICGYVLSLIINYFLTIYWTFKTKPSAMNVVGIIASHLFNLFVVRMGLMCIFVNTLNFNDRIAYVPTIAISVITNFIIIKCVINKTK